MESTRWYEKIGGRKFIGVMTVIFISTGLNLIDNLTGGEWVTINTLSLAIFGGANAWSKLNSNHSSSPPSM